MDILSDNHNCIACWSSNIMKEADAVLQECTAAVNSTQELRGQKAKSNATFYSLNITFETKSQIT